jgi:hypothetical protein
MPCDLKRAYLGSINHNQQWTQMSAPETCGRWRTHRTKLEIVCDTALRRRHFPALSQTQIGFVL